MLEVFKLIGKVAPSDATVLITGETGTGKELVAEALHRASKRNPHPLVKVNCAALPETLLESELFGHEKGSFTGAMTMRKGRFETANKGTIFLDEIGEMTLGTQTKLLRVLQEREFERIGSNTPIKIDIRVIAATNRNLAEEVEKGQLPRGPLLPPERHPHPHAAAARAQGRHPAARRALPRRSTATRPSAIPTAITEEALQQARSTTTGRATCASSRTPSSAPWSCRAATRSRSSTCRSATADEAARPGEAGRATLPPRG